MAKKTVISTKKRKPATAEAKRPSASVAVKRPRGRPPKYSDPDVFGDACEAYFDDPECDYTMCGLALALDFCERRSLYEYLEKPGFSAHVKKALTRIERNHERRVTSGTPTGHIFVLKNMGWSDKQDIRLGGDAENPIRVIFEDASAIPHGRVKRNDRQG